MIFNGMAVQFSKSYPESTCDSITFLKQESINFDFLAKNVAEIGVPDVGILIGKFSDF